MTKPPSSQDWIFEEPGDEAELSGGPLEEQPESTEEGKSQVHEISAERRWPKFALLATLVVALVVVAQSLTGSDGTPEAHERPGQDIDDDRPAMTPDDDDLGPDWISVEILQDVNFDLGAPAGSLFGFNNDEYSGALVDLSNGELTLFSGMSVLTILDDYVVGSATPTDGEVRPESSLAVYNRASGQVTLLAVPGEVTQVAPAELDNHVWTISESREGSVLSLVNVASLDLPTETTYFEEPIRLTGASGRDPLVSARTSGVYRAAVGGPEFISRGRAITKFEDRSVVFECDNQLTCSVQVNSEAVGEGVQALSSERFGPSLEAALGANGLAIIDGSILTVINLDSGSETGYPLPVGSWDTSPVWAGRYLVARGEVSWALIDTSDGRLWSFSDVTAGTVDNLVSGPRLVGEASAAPKTGTLFLSGEIGARVVAFRLGEREPKRLGLEGRPLVVASQWLVMHTEAGLEAVDLSVPNPLPDPFTDLDGSRRRITAVTDSETVWIRYLGKDGLEGLVRGFKIGSWEEVEDVPSDLVVKSLIEPPPGDPALAAPSFNTVRLVPVATDWAFIGAQLGD